MAFSTPRRVVLGLPSLPPESVRVGARTRTKFSWQWCTAEALRARAPLIIMNLAFWWETRKKYLGPHDPKAGGKERRRGFSFATSFPWSLAYCKRLWKPGCRWLIQMRRASDRGDFIGFISGPIQSFSVKQKHKVTWCKAF